MARIGRSAGAAVAEVPAGAYNASVRILGAGAAEADFGACCAGIGAVGIGGWRLVGRGATVVAAIIRGPADAALVGAASGLGAYPAGYRIRAWQAERPITVAVGLRGAEHDPVPRVEDGHRGVVGGVVTAHAQLVSVTAPRGAIDIDVVRRQGGRVGGQAKQQGAGEQKTPAAPIARDPPFARWPGRQ